MRPERTERQVSGDRKMICESQREDKWVMTLCFSMKRKRQTLPLNYSYDLT